METKNSRSKELLNNVYDQLDSIDLKKLSMREIKDFLEVVREGQFLESFGKMPPYGYGFGGMSAATFNSLGNPADRTGTSDTGDKQG